MTEWNSKKIKDFEGLEIILGQSPSSKSYNNNKVGLPFLQGKAEFGTIYPAPEIYTDSPMKIAEANDILISVRAPVGDVNLSPFKLSIGRGLAALRFKKHNPRFYFYWFSKNQKFIENLGVGSIFKAITGEQLRNIEIPIVDTKEQTAIANILSTIDEAIQKSDEAIKKTERIKHGMLQKLLTEGIGHTKFKETKFGRMPKAWELVKLSNVGKLKRENYQPQPNGNLPFVGLEHISSAEFYLNNFGTEKDVVSSKSKFSKSDILYGKLRPYLDKVVVSQVDGIASTDILIISSTHKVISDFLLFILHSKKFLSFSIARMSGTNHPRVSWKDISKFVFGLPTIEEQKKISSIIIDLQRKKELEIKRMEVLSRIKQGLMDDLLTGRKRVKL